MLITDLSVGTQVPLVSCVLFGKSLTVHCQSCSGDSPAQLFISLRVLVRRLHQGKVSLLNLFVSKVIKSTELTNGVFCGLQCEQNGKCKNAFKRKKWRRCHSLWSLQTSKHTNITPCY